MDLLRAIGLLTVLPVRPSWDAEAQPGRAMAFYPAVGALIGGVLAGLAYLLALRRLPETAALLPAALLLAAWAALTGALHLDGWADCCDALFVPADRGRRLEILRDPRLGAFGGVGLALLLIVKLAAIQAILARPGFVPVLIVTPVMARWALVVAAASAPLARPDGMAAHFRQGLGRREVIVATLTAALAAVLAGWVGLALWGAAALAALLLSRLAVARLGGLTGDVYGAIVEASETAALVTACLV